MTSLAAVVAAAIATTAAIRAAVATTAASTTPAVSATTASSTPAVVLVVTAAPTPAVVVLALVASTAAPAAVALGATTRRAAVAVEHVRSTAALLEVPSELLLELLVALDGNVRAFRVRIVKITFDSLDRSLPLDIGCLATRLRTAIRRSGTAAGRSVRDGRAAASQ